MRHLFSAAALLVAGVASIATSTLPETTSTTQVVGPPTTVTPRAIERIAIDVLATQSPGGPFGGALQLDGQVTAVMGEVRVTATLERLDADGATVIASDTVTASPGSDGDLFLFDDLHAFAACAAGTRCDQALELVLATDGDAEVSWSLRADLDDVDGSGRTGTVEVLTP